MAELVQEDVGQTAITADERRGEGRQVGILHTTVREGRRQDDGIVSSPGVGRDDLFSVLKESLCVGLKLPLHSICVGRLGPDTCTFAELAELEITSNYGNEIGGDADGLLEVVGVGSRRLGVVLESRHENGDVRVNGGSVGDLVGRRVDARYERAAVNGLALRVEERIGLADSLLLCEPAESSALGSGGICDDKVDLVALFVERRRDRNVKRCAESATLCTQLELDILAFDGNVLDIEVTGVEGDGVETGLDELDDVRDVTRNDASIPVDAPVEVKVNWLVLRDFGVGVDVLWLA